MQPRLAAWPATGRLPANSRYSKRRQAPFVALPRRFRSGTQACGQLHTNWAARRSSALARLARHLHILVHSVLHASCEKCDGGPVIGTRSVSQSPVNAWSSGRRGRRTIDHRRRRRHWPVPKRLVGVRCGEVEPSRVAWAVVARHPAFLHLVAADQQRQGVRCLRSRHASFHRPMNRRHDASQSTGSPGQCRTRPHSGWSASDCRCWSTAADASSASSGPRSRDASSRSLR